MTKHRSGGFGMKRTVIDKWDEEVFLLAAITVYFFDDMKVDVDCRKSTGLNG